MFKAIETADSRAAQNEPARLYRGTVTGEAMTCIAVMFSNFGIILGIFVFFGAIVGLVCGYLMGRRDGSRYGRGATDGN